MNLKSIICLSLLAVAGKAFAQKKEMRIDSLLNALHHQGKLNGNILIAEKGKTIYLKSFGYANEQTKEKLTVNSIFELASCSKQFTAMGIVILKEQGKLKFEDKIVKYLPELSIYKDITVRNLLNHTSGLADYMSVMDTIFDKRKIATNKDIISIFEQQHPALEFESNTKFKYSNTGYVLLATIIERVSGKSYANFLKTHVFKPLKMESSFVYNRRLQPRKIDHYAFGYLYNRAQGKYVLPDSVERAKMVYWLDGVVGDGTVNSTVQDLLKWDRALYSDKLISKESLAQMFSPAVLNDGSFTKYGFGWKLEQHADYGKVIRHSGGWPGYKTDIERHVDNDLTIIVLQNHYDALEPTKAIRNILYNQPIALTP